jgi:tetratricopeptide (TPR) repeat protein
LAKRHWPVLLAALFSLLIQRPLESRAAAAGDTISETQVCDSLADYFLGMEDYPEAIRRHQAVIRDHPENALAHYHLGFAYGLMGHHRRELAEYEKAVDLGLSDWDLFLNLGLLYVETDQLDTASKVLELAAVMAPERPETHYNLGLAYEKRGKLQQAEQEMLLSLQLDPSQVDVRNQLGVIYAEEGNYMRARDEWRDLANSAPGYSPARTNLTLLRQAERGGTFGIGARSGAFAHTP